MIFVDSSFLIAFTLETDTNHTRAKKVLLQVKNKYTSEDIVKETLTVISQRKGRKYCIEFFEGFTQECIILPVTTDRYRLGLELFLNPRLQKDVSLIDCITAAICKEMGIKIILTFDPHFRLLGLTPRP